MKIIKLSLPLLLAACHGGYENHYSSDTTTDLDGVWRGAVSEAKALESIQAHVLDGLVLAVSEDGQRGHSGELVLDGGELAGVMAIRDDLGERDRDYAVIGYADAYDYLQADLINDVSDAQISLHYDRAHSDVAASYSELSGLYQFNAPELQLTLSIDDFGFIEGYDDAGCAYFGRLRINDLRLNVYEVSLDVEACTLDGEYAFGIASLEYDRSGWPQLVLPVWMDEQDRVEPWILIRV